MKEKEETSFTGGEWKTMVKTLFFFFFKGMQPPSVRHSRLKAAARAQAFAFLARYIYIEREISLEISFAQPVAVKRFYSATGERVTIPL